MVSENPVIPPRAMGLTPIFPVTTDWGTVEIPDFARITKLPEAPSCTGLVRVALSFRTVGLPPSALVPVTPFPSCVQPATSATSRNATEVVAYPFECFMVVPLEDSRACEAA